MPIHIMRSASGALVVPHFYGSARSLLQVLIRDWSSSPNGSKAHAIAIADILAVVAAHPRLGPVEQWRENLTLPSPRRP